MVMYSQLQRGYWWRKRRKRHHRRAQDYHPPLPYRAFEFSLDSWPTDAYHHKLKLERTEVERLLQVLDLEDIQWRNRIKPSAELALCVLLRRLAYPAKWTDYCEDFGRSPGYLSVVLTTLLNIFQHGMINRSDGTPCSYQKLRQYAEAIKDAGAEGYIWGFIDGHFMGFSRPLIDQQVYSSGHYKAHGLKLQGMVTPDGLIASLEGPCFGKEDDWSIYQSSRVPRRIYRMMNRGDPAYVNAYGIMAPFQHRRGFQHLSQNRQSFNRTMSSLRISVEHAFGMVFRTYTATAFASSLQLGQQPVAAHYRVAALLINCTTCIRQRNQTTDRFGVPPPSLEEYLGYEQPTVGGE
ncbi:hypothetical protein KC342_g9748 [Hortaea werneckii]|nr:hypothetical protein KC342_g9748 [Hortaea werneckii]KAI7400738.1 hypothetical protein KC328_g3437 [Hortaea werneckii]